MSSKKKLVLIGSVTLTLLFIPLIAMQLTEEVNWNAFDFLVAGVLLFTTGLILDLAANKLTKKKYRLIVCAFIILVFLIIWMGLAVGIFGTPFAGD